MPDRVDREGIVHEDDQRNVTDLLIQADDQRHRGGEALVCVWREKPIRKHKTAEAGSPGYFLFSSAGGILVACQFTTCHLPSRLRNVPLFR